MDQPDHKRTGRVSNQDKTTTVTQMQATYSPTAINRPHDRTGTLLSIAGLMAWLTAMILAIAGPLLGLEISPMVIVGMIVFSAAFSVLSLPKLIGLGKCDDEGQLPDHR